MNIPFAPTAKKRGRPPKAESAQRDVRRAILRTGVEVLTESAFGTSSLDVILKRAGVPKGSFYHYFASKEAFGLAVLDQYDSFFDHLLSKTLANTALPPLQRIESFVDAAAAGMAKHAFRRGCAVGNLTQEVATLPEAFRQKLKVIFEKWQAMMLRCLHDLAATGHLSASADLPGLADFFWTGWEGAVLQAKLHESRKPLDNFLQQFLASLLPRADA